MALTRKSEPAPQQSTAPFLQPDGVSEKAYSGLNIKMDQSLLEDEIPEPGMQAPFDDDDTDFEEFSSNDTSKQQTNYKQHTNEEEPFNPQFHEMPAREKEKGAENLAKMAVSWYEFLHQYANNGMMISKKKLLRWQEKGWLDLSVEIPYGRGNVRSIEKIVEAFNLGILENPLTVSDEFKAEVIPLLTEIFKQKGLGLTPEQRLLQIVIMDLFQKGQIFFEMKAQGNALLDVIKQGFAEMRMNNAAFMQQQQMQQQQTTQQQTRTEPAPQGTSKEEEAVAKEVKPNVVILNEKHK